jgi:hypothetical protein
LKRLNIVLVGLILGLAGFPEVAEVLVAKEFDEGGVVGGGVLVEGVIEIGEGAAEGSGRFRGGWWLVIYISHSGQFNRERQKP